jgi:hypothetical protein
MPAVPFDRTTQRLVAAECLTEGGWVTGQFHVPATQSFVDFLQHTGAFLPMTDVRIPGRETTLPFLALQREALRLVAPDPDDALIQSLGTQGFTSPWTVTCLFAEGTIEGFIDFLTNQRLSDHLRAARGLLLLREATWQPGPGASAEEPIARRWPVVLVSVARMAGIAEAEVQRGHGHPGRLSSPDELNAG